MTGIGKLDYRKIIERRIIKKLKNYIKITYILFYIISQLVC